MKTLTTLPSNQLSRNKFFYVYYDTFWALVCAAVLVVFSFTGAPNLLPQWKPEYLAWLPLACYVQILCSVFIHNASHANFPKALNRIVGELCGLVVLTRFASWEIVHRRHHRYSDDREKDPHPVQRNYWKFAWAAITSVERQLQNNFQDLYGYSEENQTFEKRRALVSYTTNILLIAVWYQILGAGGFWGFFFPVSIIGFLHLMHFNWTTHDATNPSGHFKPVDQDKGILWVGNRIFFGIYNHDIHHRCPRIFNPVNKREVARKLRPIRDADGVGVPVPAVPAYASPNVSQTLET